jgi:hypothetical protein
MVQIDVDPYDGSWKLGLDGFLPQVMLLLFPKAYSEIDWSRSYEPLNAELQAILPPEETSGRRFADALYKVWRHDGREQWIVLHFEVQTQPDPGLPLRMWVYGYRGFEKYQTEIFGFAILGDRNPGYRPGPYAWQLGNARLVYEYEVAKLLDHRVENLEASDNPAALLVLAHHYTMSSKNRPPSRRQYKLHLVRLLFRKGFGPEQADRIFKLLDRMMRLDREQAIIFTREVATLREEPEMSAYVHTFEWVFREQGIEEGKQIGKQIGIEAGKQIGIEAGKLQMLRAQLVRRFGELPTWADSRLSAASGALLDQWSLQLLDASRLEDVFD